MVRVSVRELCAIIKYDDDDDAYLSIYLSILIDR